MKRGLKLTRHGEKYAYCPYCNYLNCVEGRTKLGLKKIDCHGCREIFYNPWTVKGWKQKIKEE